MTAFLIGFLISVFAAAPALFMATRQADGKPKIQMKLWVIGAAIRFSIIGILLLLLFRFTEVSRIPAVLGVVAAYFISFGLEVYLVNRPAKPE
jgi:peptidoglycan/LPS O-acetylase OafA/YrhL